MMLKVFCCPLLDDIYKYDTESLIEFLRKNTQIKDKYLDILREQEITGSIFFKITEETFRSYGLKGGPEILVEFAKECMENIKRPSGSLPVGIDSHVDQHQQVFPILYTGVYQHLADLSSVLSKFNIYRLPYHSPMTMNCNNV